MAKTALAIWLGAVMTMGSIMDACADEILIPNSTSPDGRYAVYAVDASDQLLPASLEIRGLKDQKPRIKLDAGGYVHLASGYDTAMRTEIRSLWSGTQRGHESQ